MSEKWYPMFRGTAGEETVIKLNTNENPYPPAPGVKEALEHLPTDRLRKYPDPAASELVCALAERYGVKPEQVFVGVGSDDVLAMAFLTFSIRKSRCCFLISLIPFMMCGRICFGFRTRPCR